MTSLEWLGRQVPVFAGTYDTHISTGECYDTRPLSSLFTMQPGSVAKMEGLAFLPTLYADHDARTHSVQRERGVFVALTGDVDEGNWSIEHIRGLVSGLVGDGAYLIYSSPHACPGDMRWRIVLPLAQPVSFADWHDAQAALLSFMGRAGVDLDRALLGAGQPVFLPNVPARHPKTGEALRGSDGAPLYYCRARTGPRSPGLQLGNGSLGTEIARLRARRAADELAHQRLRVDAQQRRRSSTSNAESPIVRFNRANPLPDLLQTYGYEQSPRHADDWRSPHQTSATYATRIVEGRKWISLSGSDAATGLGQASAAGCFGDAFDLFVHFEHGGDRKAALRSLGEERR
ncbi:MAG: hypothetical protein V4579_13795 [Pseudomonadota bacterium]